MKLAEWLAAIEQLEPELLSAPPLEEIMHEAATLALNRGGRLQLVLDLYPLQAPRLRVRVVSPSGGWWLSDSMGRVAHAAHVAGEGAPNAASVRCW
jgi:hypothetical protein